jgi:hypothetical protein
MLQNPEFDSKDIDPDLHQQMTKAVDDGSIKCFNLQESAADGDQDLNLWICEVELVMCSRCYPFNLPKKRFHSINPQVGCCWLLLHFD